MIAAQWYMRAFNYSCTHRFEDEGICHYYLVGMCPYEEFERTKHDVGPCPFVHDDDLRDQFQVS